MAKVTRESIGKPIEPGIVSRIAQGVRYIITGAGGEAWFGPMQPLEPLAQKDNEDGGARGRQRDYAVGYNQRHMPKHGEGVTFDQLRAFADGYDLLRLAIEKRKDQIESLQFRFKRREGDTPKDDPTAKALKATFAMPDGHHTWGQWLRALVEEQLVIDAACVFPRFTRGGALYSLDLLDGATITPKLDAAGRTPIPPNVAYQQVLKGVPAVDYHRDELVYFPRNVRVSRVYGYSPVEQVLTTVNIALRRQAHQLSYYTEGSTPNLIFSVPETWNTDQIKQFQLWWDELTNGDQASKYKTKFVPAGVEPIDTKGKALKDEFDEWLARIICYAFSLSPQALIKENNRATAETAKEAAAEEGLGPLMLWVKSLIDCLVSKYIGQPDYEFEWADEEVLDAETQARIDQIYLTAKALHPDEVRTLRLGLPPLTPEQKADLTPPPPPQLGGPGGGQDGEEEEEPGGAPPGKKTPKAQEGDAAKKYRAAQPLKKGKRKAVKPISRERKAVTAATKKATASIEALLASNLADCKSFAIALLDELRGNASKAEGGLDAIKARVLRDLAFDGLSVFVTNMEQVLGELYADGGLVALAQIGLDDAAESLIELVNVRDVAYAKERAAEMVGKSWVNGELVDNPRAEWVITDMQREATADLVVEAMQEGYSNEKLAAMLDDAAAFGESRALMIARTETAYADVAGNMAAYRESGQVVGKRWLVGAEQCDDCKANAEAGEIPLDGVFPDGSSEPPAHPNCRCDIEPVLLDTD